MIAPATLKMRSTLKPLSSKAKAYTSETIALSVKALAPIQIVLSWVVVLQPVIINNITMSTNNFFIFFSL